MIHNQLQFSCQRLPVVFKPSDPEPSPPASGMLRVVLFKSYEINLCLFVISWKSTVQSPLRLMLDPDTSETRMVLLHRSFLSNYQRSHTYHPWSLIWRKHTQKCGSGMQIQVTTGISSQVHSIEHCRFKNCLWSSRAVSVFVLAHLQT